jgi:hypothetical protein
VHRYLNDTDEGVIELLEELIRAGNSCIMSSVSGQRAAKAIGALKFMRLQPGL